MLSLINWRLKVTINDGRALTGQMLAFDRHMNLVLADCEEFRRVRPKKKAGEETAPEQEMKRTLGLVILRGETVVSISVEGPPPVVDEDKKANAVRDWTQYRHRSAIDLFLLAPNWSWSRHAGWPRDDTIQYAHHSSKFHLDSRLNHNFFYTYSRSNASRTTTYAVCTSWYARTPSWFQTPSRFPSWISSAPTRFFRSTARVGA